MKCKHCGRGISDDAWPVHTDGGYRGKHSCDPDDSGRPYGYSAAAPGSDCQSPCIGAPR